MTNPPHAVAEQIARAAAASQRQRTGHEPSSVSVVIGGDTLVVTLHGALSPAEAALARSPDGAAKVQEYHRELFASGSRQLRGEVKRITGADVPDVIVEWAPPSGAVVGVFPDGTMIQIFQLSGRLTAGSYNA